MLKAKGRLFFSHFDRILTPYLKQVRGLLQELCFNIPHFRQNVIYEFVFLRELICQLP